MPKKYLYLVLIQHRCGLDNAYRTYDIKLCYATSKKNVKEKIRHESGDQLIISKAVE